HSQTVAFPWVGPYRRLAGFNCSSKPRYRTTQSLLIVRSVSSRKIASRSLRLGAGGYRVRGATFRSALVRGSCEPALLYRRSAAGQRSMQKNRRELLRHWQIYNLVDLATQLKRFACRSLLRSLFSGCQQRKL